MEKWLILQQNHGLNPLENCQFFDFFNFLFLKPNKFFFLCRIYNTFSCPILPKKRWKNGQFRTKTMDKPLWKNVTFWTFRTSWFFSLDCCFFLLECHTTHLLGLYCLKKRWKNGQFRTKTMNKPLWKNVTFWTFRTSWFLSLDCCFFLLECHTTHFPGLYCLKKKSWKMANFGTKPWTNPFGKMLFLDFLNFLFISRRKLFLRSSISYNTCSWAILL